MKRILLLIILSFVAVSASAQLNVVRKTKPSDTIYSGRVGNLKLARLEVGYALFMLNTGNRFDTGGAYLHLGETKEETFNTLKDLYDLCESLKDGGSITIDNIGREIDIRCRKQMGFPTLYFDFPGVAGKDCCVSKQELEKMIDKLIDYEPKEESEE